jgi:ABC-2 type transport system permease protein
MMRDALRVYRRYLGISLRSQLQYRAAFAMQVLGHTVATGVEFLAIWALFARFGSLAGWTLPEVALLYGMADVTFAIADAIGRGFDMLGSLVKGGDFDRILLRPRSTVLQLMGQELTLKRVGRLGQGLAILLWASHAGLVAWSPAKVLLLLGAIGGGVCLYLGLTIIAATSVFWTIESLEIWNAFSYGGNYATQYPLPIYRRWFRRFLLVVLPLGCVNYLPGVAILGRPDPLATPLALRWLAPLAGVAFLAVALRIWQGGVRRYVSTGS